uniref:Sulfataselike protein putative n=1 Tax=Albugo laibachii Nc14 TaxID=890382 RepID=F0W034_9STRA|nr:sulfataselike protein putative [Albugo laibachii Nc14]|eukprot:CCA14405.1 sulfataselike protein putative [Albugo laibachii Nc14]
MVSWGEVILTLTAASYVIGRKELPKIGNIAGVYTGRAVGALIRAKKEFFDATKDSKVVQMQRQLQKGLDELNDIRQELASVGSMKRPYQPEGSNKAGSQRNVTQSDLEAANNIQPDSSVTYKNEVSRPDQLASASWGSSLSLASSHSLETSDVHRSKSDSAALAVAEMKLSRRDNTYTTRIESLEGGADYVSASIVDSLLIKPLDGHVKDEKSSQDQSAKVTDE